MVIFIVLKLDAIIAFIIASMLVLAITFLSNYKIVISKREGNYPTMVAVNIGGCLIPLIVGIVLVATYTKNLSSLAILLTSLLVSILIAYKLSIVVISKGTYIELMLQSLASSTVIVALSEVINLGLCTAIAISYFTGILCTLVGADLLNLIKIKDIPELSKDSIMTIGGKGIFDAIHLSGLSTSILTLILWHLP